MPRGEGDGVGCEGTLLDRSATGTGDESVSTTTEAPGSRLVVVRSTGTSALYSISSSAVALSRFEESDASFEFSAGWLEQSHSSYSGGTARSTTSVGSSFEVLFSGPVVRLVGLRAPNRGSAEIAIDGVVVATVDAWSASYEFGAVLFEESGLSDGAHVLTVRYVGAGASGASTVYLTIDAVEMVA
jgi:hypothetical protein